MVGDTLRQSDEIIDLTAEPIDVRDRDRPGTRSARNGPKGLNSRTSEPIDEGVNESSASYDHVLGHVSSVLGTVAANIWLRSENAYLDGATPHDWLHSNNPAAIAIAAFDASEAGSYA